MPYKTIETKTTMEFYMIKIKQKDKGQEARLSAQLPLPARAPLIKERR